MSRAAPFPYRVRASSATRRRPIDLNFLSKQTLGDAGLQSEVLRVYDRIQHTYFERARVSTSAVQMKHHLQLLKAAAAGVGAHGLVALTRAAEDDLSDGKAVDEERLADLGFAIEEISLFIAGLLGERRTLN
jgi:hypothetical protein